MKIIGEYLDGWNTLHFSRGCLVALEVNSVNVEPFSFFDPPETEHRFFLQVRSGDLKFEIQTKNGAYHHERFHDANYMSLEFANSIVKDLAMKDVVDLDDYGLGFRNVIDVHERVIVCNDIDDEGQLMPLDVNCV